ncbi:MAG: hypothetical protein OXC95_03430 [Dehalococcoidia bacterium]|nr:hypothetical protein [Dehalococcoidia bacterium]
MALLNQVETSQSLISQARTEYEKGDLRRASELIWESGYHAVRAISEQRGWKFDTPADMFRAADRLALENDREEIYTLFQVAFISPYNFNEGWLNGKGIAMNIKHVKKLLATLKDIE